VLGWCAVEAIGRLQDAADPKAAAECFDALRLRGPLADAFAALGLEGEERWRAAARVRASFEHAAHAHAPYAWTHDPDAAWVIGAHQHEGVSYITAEQFENLLWWMALREFLDLASEPRPDLKRLASVTEDIKSLLSIVEREGYRVEALEDAALPGSAEKPESETEQNEEKVERRS
jgi:hypothetical protein